MLGGVSVPGVSPPPPSAYFALKWTLVIPGYFGTLGVRILEGRDFTDVDRKGAEPVVILGRRAVEQFWPGRTGVGQFIIVHALGPGAKTAPVRMRVVGVVKDVSREGRPDIYVPLPQHYHPTLTILARRDSARSVTNELRDAVSALDADLPLLSAQPLESLVNGPIETQLRVAATVAGVVGMVGLRIVVYRLQGWDYDFGDWGRQFLYEYLKDVRTFAWMVLVIEAYRFLLRRWQGEASLLDLPDEGPPVEPVERPERFLVRKLGREFLIAASDIEWLQAASNYVNLRVRGHDYPLRSTIGGIEANLDPRRFVRIHRSYIVNLESLARVEPYAKDSRVALLKDGTRIPVSRAGYERLKGLL